MSAGEVATPARLGSTRAEAAGRAGRAALRRGLLQIALDRASDVPLFLQIKRHVERLVARGVLTPDAKLPATRELARALGVTRATVATAYELLVAEGWARAHVGQGTFVARRETPVPPPAAPAVRLDWEAARSRVGRRVVAEARGREGLEPASGGDGRVISLVGTGPDPTLVPLEAFRRALNRVLRREGASLLQYHPVAGYPPLCRYLAGWLVRHGIEASESEVLIVSGSQQGLDLIARALLDPGDLVAVEQPTYPGALQAFAAAQAEILPVPLGPGGLRVDVLAALLERQRPKLLYCQPGGQNPTGLSLDPAARRRLVELLDRHRVPAIEDGFGGPADAPDAPPPLRALDPAGLVIHLGTFSKLLFPGLRLGWLVVPRPLVPTLVGIKQLADLHTSALLQAAVLHFAQRRRLERHARLVRREYARRRAALLAALPRHLPPGTTWTTPDTSGVSLLVTLPEGLDSAELLPRALARGVTYAPGRVFFTGGEGARTLRLAYAAVPAPRIEEGVRRLGEVAREALRRRRPANAPSRALPLV